MNLWYVTAIILGALAAFCGYYGSIIENRRGTQEQAQRIEVQLQKFGNRLQAIRNEPTGVVAQEVAELEREYKSLAKQFFDSLPLRAAEQKARDANQQVDQIQRSRAIENHFRELEQESRQLAEAYNRTAGRPILQIASNDFPVNIFSRPVGEQFYILYSFDNSAYWAARLVMYPDQTPALQFVRLQSLNGSADYSKMSLTNDSINLVLLPEEFSLSLNQSISPAVAENIVVDMPRLRRPIAELDGTTATLARRIIEYQMVMSQAEGKS